MAHPKSLLPCLVRFREASTVHEVEVMAGSVMEAAALGYRELKQDPLASIPDEAVAIEVAVQRPAVVHRVSLESLKAWARGKSPREILEREPIRKMLEGD